MSRLGILRARFATQFPVANGRFAACELGQRFPALPPPSSDTDVLIQALSIVLDGALADWYEGARVRSRGCRLIRARCSIQLWQSPDARPRAMSIGDLWTTIEPFHRCGIGLALISRHS